MRRVCVVGGGTAGREAALEAGRRGADVTIVERFTHPDPPYQTWADLISCPGGGVHESELESSGLVMAAEARSAGPGAVVLSGGQKLTFDSVILATGARFLPSLFPGIRKRGVFVLDDAEKYRALGRACASVNEAVISGEGRTGLQVAERMSGRGVKVRLAISRWQFEPPSAVAFCVIEEAAQERCVEIQSGTVAGAVGDERVEAALVEGSVLPCDALVVVPPRAPNVVHSRLRLGREGAVAVNSAMRTSEPSVYAAGGCAELKTDAGWRTLGSEASLSGRIAGSNCLGSAHSIGRADVVEIRVFGLRWLRIGMGSGGADLCGKKVATVSRRWGEASACSIVHEVSSERVLGVESVQPSSSHAAGLPPLDAGVTLEALALGLGSSDISPITETARLGLKAWQRS